MLNELIRLLAQTPDCDDEDHEALIGDSAVIAIARALLEQKESLECAEPVCSAR